MSAPDSAGDTGVNVLDALPDQMRERTTRRRLAVVGVVLAGLALRGIGLGAESIWYDEYFTASLVEFRSYEFIAFEMPTFEPHPPLYYLLVKGWTGLAGVSATGLRSFSVVVDAGSVALTYLVATRLYDRRVGLASALLFALSPFYVYYGREARMYALATFLALASMYLLVRMADGDRRWRIPVAYLLTTVAMCYTHAFGPLVVAAQNVAVFGALAAGWLGDEGSRWRAHDLSVPRWVGLQAAIAVASLPYYGVLYRQTFVTERLDPNVAWVPEVTPGTVWKLLGSYVGRAVPPIEPWGRTSYWAFGPSGELAVLGDLVTLGAIAVAGYAAAQYVRTDRDSDGFAPEPLLVAWGAVPVGVLYALSQVVQPVLYDRFTAMAGVALLVLLARGLVALVETRRDLAVVGAVVLVAFAVPLGTMHTAPQKPQLREAVETVEANAEGDHLVAMSPQWDDSWRYYVEGWTEGDRPAASQSFRVESIRAGAGQFGLQNRVRGHRVVWFLFSHVSDRDRELTVEGMRDLGYEVERHDDLARFDLYKFTSTRQFPSRAPVPERHVGVSGRRARTRTASSAADRSRGGRRPARRRT